MAKTKTTPNTTTRQVAKFGIVGILNTLIDYVLYIGLTVLFSIPLERVWMAKLVSGSVAMTHSFLLNRAWVFRREHSRHGLQEFGRFMASTFVAVYIIQLGLVQLFTSIWPAPGIWAYDVFETIGVASLLPSDEFVIKTVAFGVATLASMTWNFLLYKLWAFKE